MNKLSMDQPSPGESAVAAATDPRSGGQRDVLAWLPLGVYIAAAAALWRLAPATPHESAILLTMLNTLFGASVGLLIAYLAARTYLVAGSRAVLLLGCGALTFGITFLLAGLLMGHVDEAVTVHNTGVCLAAACFLHSATRVMFQGLRQEPPPSPRWMVLAYVSVALVLGLVTVGALADAVPDFYVVGQGRTVLGRTVLVLALVEFATASLCFGILHVRSGTRFLRWYCIGLALIAAGIGSLLLGGPGTPVAWLGRCGQWLGSLYMLIAVLTVVQGRSWGIPLERALLESEEALRESERRFRVALENSPVLVYTTDANLRVTWAYNPPRGFTLEQIIGKRDDEILPAEDAAEMMAFKREVMASGRGARREIGFRVLGHVRYYDFTAEPVRDDAGQVVGLTVAAMEITERKVAEQTAALRAAELQALLDAAPIAIWIAHDPACRRITGNVMADRLMHAPRSANVSASALPGEAAVSYRLLCKGVELKPEQMPAQLACATGRPVLDEELQLVFDDGRTVYLAESAVPLFDGQGRVRGAVIAGADITRRKQAEQQLQDLNATLEKRVAERTAIAEARAEQLRRLAEQLTQAEQRERQRIAHILHEHLQQLLVGAKFNLSMVRAPDLLSRESLRRVDQVLTEAVEASRSLAVELSPPILRYGGLAAALEWLGQGMREKHGLRVEVLADPDIPALPEDVQILLFQAASELLFNVTKHAKVDSARVELRREEGSLLRLCVCDEGIGLGADHVVARASSDGGLGLFSIRERVGFLGGRVEICSVPGAGTRICLLVPLPPAAGAGSLPVAAGGSPARPDAPPRIR